MSTPAERRRIAATVQGVVQGVGFRRFVERTGDRLDLAGWVRNDADGSVRLEAEGPADAIGALITALHAGPAGAWVRSVELRELPPSGAVGGFTIRSGAHRGD